MVNFGDLIGHSNKDRVRNSLYFAWAVVLASMFSFYFGEMEHHFEWGPSDSLIILGIKINTNARYVSLVPWMIAIDISILLLKLYPKSLIEFFLVLPTDQLIEDYTPWELFKTAMEAFVTMAVIKFYTWNFIFNRIDILLMSFIVKLVLIGVAFWYRIGQLRFACHLPPSTDVNKQAL